LTNIKLVRRGRKNTREYMYQYTDKPSELFITTHRHNRKINPKELSGMLAHENVHSVLQRNLGTKVNSSFDRVAFKNPDLTHGRKRKWLGI
jgi:hypothetical protein